MPEQVPAGPGRLELTASLPHRDTDAAFDLWTIPSLLAQWWPPEAEVEPGQGGTYHFHWPSQGWHLRGTFTDFVRGKRLTYTWRWDHDPHDAESLVNVAFRPDHNGGTSLTLTHGPYQESDAGYTRRQEHLDGWMYFLGRLEALS